ncbi:MAG: hypothetical protein DME23_07310 [Verrucomicrobia bacterium]|nr:MAG: hypothetical protein DME23_07310 [Verrucomicrobiota bacterium]
MIRPRTSRKPTFFWQAVLILLPVVVLAAMGFFSLRQDRLLAEQEARERAAAVAGPLARELGLRLKMEVDEFAEASRRHEEATSLIAGTLRAGPVQDAAEEIRNAQAVAARWQQEHPVILLRDLPQARCFVREGVLFKPRNYDNAPQPPDWYVHLNGRPMMEQWNAAEAAWNQRRDPAAGRAILEKLLQGRQRSDDPLCNAIELKLLLIEEGHSDREEMFGAFRDLMRKYPRDSTESGLPISAIACHEAIRLAPSGKVFGDFLDDFVFNMQNAPSILTGKLLAELEARAAAEDEHVRERVRAIQGTWNIEEKARNLLRLLPGTNLPVRGVFDLNPASGRFLAVCLPMIVITTNHIPNAVNSSTNVDGQILLLPAAVLDEAARRAMQEINNRLPAYATMSVLLRLGEKQFGFAPRSARGFHSNLEQFGTNWLRVVPALPNPASRADPLNTTLTTVTDGFSSPALGGYVPFTLDIVLADPDLMFARHLQRVRLFGGIIILAAAIALVGLFAAWRAFHRQLILAEMKTNFVSSVSHELRAPIASVRLLAESLDRGKISDAQKQADYFRLIVQECRRLTSLIENVLDFSRIGQGGKQYEFEATDLVALVEQTLKLMEPYAAERQVKLNVAMDRHQPSTLNPQPEIDARAIQQALVNLLDNAIKHAPPGTTVSVGLESSLNSQPSTINLFVEDHGDGIPPDEHQKIFEPFYRRGTELRRETQGIGIGLTIVKHIVKAHGGKVTVRSAVGQGSRFTIKLLLKEIPKPKDQ